MDYDLTELLFLLSAEGQAQLITVVGEARQKAGADFLTLVQTSYPTFYQAIWLAANGSAEASYDWIEGEFKRDAGAIMGPIFLAPFKAQIYQLHATLRAEIDRPRPGLAKIGEIGAVGEKGR